ncbi:GRXC3 [Linum grandiflorum]
MYQTEAWYLAAARGGEERSRRREGVEVGVERIERLAERNAVGIFSMSSCCMCHSIKRLFCSMGVNPTVYELDHQNDPFTANDMEMALLTLLATTSPPSSSSVAVPIVFIGGQLDRAMDRVMASHLMAPSSLYSNKPALSGSSYSSAFFSS